jgi:hypothetical protein
MRNLQRKSNVHVLTTCYKMDSCIYMIILNSMPPLHIQNKDHGFMDQ